MKEILIAILRGVAAVVLVLGAVVALALVGGNLMTLFGFRYQSVSWLIGYFLLVELVSLPFDALCQSLPRALQYMKKVDHIQGNFLYIPLDTICTYFAFWLVDQQVSQVAATGLSLWVISFLLALITMPLRKERPTLP